MPAAAEANVRSSCRATDTADLVRIGSSFIAVAKHPKTDDKEPALGPVMTLRRSGSPTRCAGRLISRPITCGSSRRRCRRRWRLTVPFSDHLQRPRKKRPGARGFRQYR